MLFASVCQCRAAEIPVPGVPARGVPQQEEISAWNIGFATYGLFDERISTHMDAGNEFRTTLGSSAALALLGIGDMRNKRKNINSSRAADEPVPRCAFLLRGLKHLPKFRL
jgi:hypothetical protein